MIWAVPESAWRRQWRPPRPIRTPLSNLHRNLLIRVLRRPLESRSVCEPDSACVCCPEACRRSAGHSDWDLNDANRDVRQAIRTTIHAQQKQGVPGHGRRHLRPDRREMHREHHPLDLRHLGAGQRHRAGNREDRRRHLVLPDRQLRLRSRARARHRGGRSRTAARCWAMPAIRSQPQTSRRSCCRRSRRKPRSSGSPMPAPTLSTQSSRVRIRHCARRPEARRAARLHHRRARARAADLPRADHDGGLVCVIRKWNHLRYHNALTVATKQTSTLGSLPLPLGGSPLSLRRRSSANGSLPTKEMFTNTESNLIHVRELDEFGRKACRRRPSPPPADDPAESPARLA